jgi:hypothetical protein
LNTFTSTATPGSGVKLGVAVGEKVAVGEWV